MESYNSRENDNHPMTNGTYDDYSPPRCVNCNEPVTTENSVLAGEFSYRHRACPKYYSPLTLPALIAESKRNSGEA